MVEEMLHYEDINSTTSKAFCKQFNCGEWSPARNLPDSKAPPTGYSANVAETKTWCGTQAKVLAMIQEAGNGTWLTRPFGQVLKLKSLPSLSSKKAVDSRLVCATTLQETRELAKGGQRTQKVSWRYGRPKLEEGATSSWRNSCNQVRMCVPWMTTHDTE